MGSLRIELILNLVFVCCLNDVNGAKVHLQLFLVIFAKVGDLNVASSTILLQLWGIFLLASQLQLLLNWSKTRHLLTQLNKTKIREISGSTQTPFCNFLSLQWSIIYKVLLGKGCASATPSPWHVLIAQEMCAHPAHITWRNVNLAQTMQLFNGPDFKPGHQEEVDFLKHKVVSQQQVFERSSCWKGAAAFRDIVNVVFTKFFHQLRFLLNQAVWHQKSHWLNY